jgi:hypothetical protein
MDHRILGTWKLDSEKRLSGASAEVPSLSPGTIVTIQAVGTDQRVIKPPYSTHFAFSSDGNTMTETASSSQPIYYQVVRVWKRQ